MAVFIESALGHASTDCAGRFTDVPTGHSFCAFIEHLEADGITTGCAAGQYCPDSPVTRAQMAVFLVAAPPPLNP
jgi:endo-1,4-beta-xylanase